MGKLVTLFLNHVAGVFQGLFAFQFSRDVTENNHGAGKLSVLFLRGGAILRRKGGAIGPVKGDVALVFSNTLTAGGLDGKQRGLTGLCPIARVGLLTWFLPERTRARPGLTEVELEEVLPDELFHTAATDHTGCRVCEGDIALSVQAIDALADGIENTALITFQLPVALLQGTLEANNPGVGTHPGNDLLGLEWL